MSGTAKPTLIGLVTMGDMGWTADPNGSQLGPTVDWATVVPAAISTYHPTEFEV